MPASTELTHPGGGALRGGAECIGAANGRWIASADTPDGPSLGCGTDAFEALWQALEPFEGVVGELLASLPADGG